MAKQKKGWHFSLSRLNFLKCDFTNKRSGFCAALVGMGIVLVLGVLAHNYSWGEAWMWWPLALGFLVGVLNIFHNESVLFLLATLTLTLTLNLLATSALFASWALTLFHALVYLFAPAAAVVSLKMYYALAVK